MTTKPRKPLPKRRAPMKIQLWVEKVKQRAPEVILHGSDIVEVRNDAFTKFKKDIQKQLDNQKENNDMSRQFSLINEVWLVLKTPELERNDDGKIKKGQDGRAQAKPFDIETQRIINRILDPIEKLIDKFGPYAKDHSTSTIEIQKPSDVLYLANRMQKHFDEYPAVEAFVPKAFDHFVDIEVSAIALEKKGEEEPDKE